MIFICAMAVATWPVEQPRECRHPGAFAEHRFAMRAGTWAKLRAVDAKSPRKLPFPTSLCHQCAAPPKYIETATSTFILCPLLKNKMPPQPVQICEQFRLRQGT